MNRARILAALPLLLVLLLALALAACASTAPPAREEAPMLLADGPPDVTPDGLVRVEGAPFELVYRRPGVDFSRYRRIQVRPISIAYAETPDLTRIVQKRDRNYRLNDEQRSRVSQAFAESLTRAMTHDGHWQLTTSPGLDTLMLRVQLANLAVYVPSGASVLDRGTLTLDEAASVTLVVELRDSMTGEPLVRGRDSGSAVLPSGRFDPQDREELRQSIVAGFDRWTALIRERLDAAVARGPES